MSTSQTAGARLRAAVEEENPLQIVGAVNAYAARMAAACGFKALYLAGSGVAANSLGMPDLGISTMDDVLIDIRRITDVCPLPMLVDADTGWGGAFNIARTVKSFTALPACRRDCISRIRYSPSVAATGRERKSFPRGKWWIASRPRSMRAPTPNS